MRGPKGDGVVLSAPGRITEGIIKPDKAPGEGLFGMFGGPKKDKNGNIDYGKWGGQRGSLGIATPSVE
jgi:hypothetical protein